jgi:hypothetical protein
MKIGRVEAGHAPILAALELTPISASAKPGQHAQTSFRHPHLSRDGSGLSRASKKPLVKGLIEF